MNDLAKIYEKGIKEEIAPLRNNQTSIIPPKFSIHNATPSELAELKKKYPSKLMISREVAYRRQAIKAVPLFGTEDVKEDQTLHASGLLRLLPSRVPENPYHRWPKTTNQDSYKYKIINKETQQMQAKPDKQFFIKKNELKYYKNKAIVE